MTSLAEVLASRRMCRDFLDVDVADDVLTPVLHAAFRGPSAGNTAGLELLVLRGSDVARYWDVTLPAGPRRDAFRWPGLLRAPVLVVPVVSPEAYVARYAQPDKAASGLGARAEDWSVPYWWIDGGAGLMAMLLAAQDAGLGALLFGQFGHEPAVREAFGVPPGRRTLGTVALGWAAPGGRSPSMSARAGRADPATRIHRGGWD